VSVRRQLSESPGVIVGEDSDQALVERWRAGDREAFTALVIRYQRPIYNAAFWILRRAEDASDITQTVFLKVAQRLDEYDARYKFFSWIYRIAVNESLNMLRRSDREEALDDEAEFPGPRSDEPEQRAAAAQLSARIRSALMRMSTGNRMVLMLRHFSECSYEEIGAILDLDEKRVKSRLYEARQQLRGMLKDLPPD
jgi:RNA polymerase sigma-70 factor (ECF subfamily)